MTPRDPLQRYTIRAASFAGFGLTVAIWLTTGYYFTRRLADIERQAAAVNARYVHAQERLSAVRAQVLIASVFVRDALLDADPQATSSYRARMDAAYRVADDALGGYVPVLDSDEEREEVARLRAEIASFREAMFAILNADRDGSPSVARVLLATRVMPKREIVLNLSEQAQALNRNAFVQRQSAIADIVAATHRRLWQVLGLALLASCAVAGMAIAYAAALERRIRSQHEKEAENARDLQRLSAKLITAQEEERRNIARELHDEVGQVLTAIKVELAVAQRAIESTGGATQLLDDARSLSESALQTVRDLSHLLHPALLDDLGLVEATSWYLKGFSKRYGLYTEFVHDGIDARLASETETTVFRIVQEALTNAAKHAYPTTCRVYLHRSADTLLVTIEDDGKGFDTSATIDGGSRGLGLINMRERAAGLRGTLTIDSREGSGTRVVVEVPATGRCGVDGAPRPDPGLREARLG